jgi:hypothetical protein
LDIQNDGNKAPNSLLENQRREVGYDHKQPS